jgi:pyruvate-ferredoxin/flavodoxin oxidoreductase
MTSSSSTVEDAANPKAAVRASALPKAKYPGIRVTCNGNQLVTQYVETRITDGGVF